MNNTKLSPVVRELLKSKPDNPDLNHIELDRMEINEK
jgi:hypothetical protein